MRRPKVRVAVVVACYNSAQFVASTVESVLSQTLRDVVVVVVDDGSEDDPRAALEQSGLRDARVRYIRQENQGVAVARNRGANAAPASDYVLFLDADDILMPMMLERLVAWLDARPAAAGAYCEVECIDESGDPVQWQATRHRLRRRGLRIEPIPDEITKTPFSSIFTLAVILPSTLLIRRSAFQTTPGWDVRFGQPYEDTLLWLHLALAGEIHRLPETLVRYRRHPGQSTADYAKMMPQELKLYTYWRNMTGFPAGERRIIEDAWRFRERLVVPWTAARAVRREIDSGRYSLAARFVSGGVRIPFQSLVRGPGRARF